MDDPISNNWLSHCWTYPWMDQDRAFLSTFCLFSQHDNTWILLYRWLSFDAEYLAKTSVYAITSYFSDFALIGIISSALVGIWSYLQFQLFHKPVYFLFVDTDISVMYQLCMDSAIAKILMFAAYGNYLFFHFFISYFFKLIFPSVY